MTGNTKPREKVRAVFLAAIMVLSVFAMSAAFAGSAAAALAATGNADADVTTAGVQTDHTFNVTYTGGLSDDLDQVEVNYSAFGTTGQDTLTDVIADNSATVLVNGAEVTVNDVRQTNTAGNDSAIVELANTTLTDGDYVEVQFAGVDNPESVETADVSVTLADTSTTLSPSASVNTNVPLQVTAPSIEVAPERGVTRVGTGVQYTATVTDSAGDPVEGVNVSVNDTDGDLTDLSNGTFDLPTTITTNADGEATITLYNVTDVGPDNDGVGTFNATFTEQVGQENDSTIKHESTDADTAYIDGDIGDDSLNPIENDQDVTITVERSDGVTVIDGVTFENFSDLAASNPHVDAADFESSTEKPADTRGEYYVEFLADGEYTYTFEASLEGFEAFDGPVTVAPSDQNDRNIRLTRIIDTDRLSVESPDSDPVTVDIEESQDATVLAETQDEPDADWAPIEDVTITTEAVITNDPSGLFSNASVTVTPTEDVTDADGLADYTVDLDTSGVNLDDVDENVETQVTFTSQDTGETATLNVTFEAEPPSGHGQISGTVSEIDSSIDLGTQSNSEVAEGVNVYAVQYDRMQANTMTVNVDSETLYRVVTDDTEEDVLDVRNDYLFMSSDADVFQNTTGDTGFEVGNQAGNVSISVLEAGDYKIQVFNATSGEFEDEGTTIAAGGMNNLTYEGIEDRYSNVSSPTDVTNENGGFELVNLYTNGSDGLQYVVIAGEGPVSPDGTNTGFANARGYDQVTVNQNAQAGDEQLQVALSVQEFEIDVFFDYDLDVTLINEDGDLVKTSEIETGEEIDVRVNVTATNQESGEDAPGAAEGQEIDLGLTDTSIGNLINTTVTVDQNDGTPYATTTFEASSVTAGTSNITANTTNELDESFTAGAAGQAQVQVFKTIEITGDVVNDDDQNIKGANVTLFTYNESGEGELNEQVETTKSGDGGSYVFSAVKSGQTLAIEATALDENGDQVTNTRILNNGDTVETSLGGEDIVVENAVEGVFSEATFDVTDLTPETYTAEHDEVFTVSATVENVGDFIGEKDVQLRLDGNMVLTKTEQLAAGANTTVEFQVDASNLDPDTYTHSVWTEDDEESGTLTVEQEPANFQLSNLDPSDPTVDQGDEFDLSVTVTNTGGQTAEQEILLGIGGDNVRSPLVELDAGNSTTITFENIDTAGFATGDHAINVVSQEDTASGTLTVEEAQTDDWWDPYTDDNDVVTTPGINDAVTDYLAGDLTESEFNTLVTSYLSGDPVPDLI